MWQRRKRYVLIEHSLTKISHELDIWKHYVTGESFNFHMWNENFIVECSNSYVIYMVRSPRFHMWNFEPVHYTCEVGISYVKTLPVDMWNDNFMYEKCPNFIYNIDVVQALTKQTKEQSTWPTKRFASFSKDEMHFLTKKHSVKTKEQQTGLW